MQRHVWEIAVGSSANALLGNKVPEWDSVIRYVMFLGSIIRPDRPAGAQRHPNGRTQTWVSTMDVI
jgi:hypothetical protein